MTAAALLSIADRLNAEFNDDFISCMGKVQWSRRDIAGLSGLLNSDDQRIRLTAVDTLRHLGDDAVPILVRTMKDVDHQDESLRAAAARALAALDPSAEAAVPALVPGNGVLIP